MFKKTAYLLCLFIFAHSYCAVAEIKWQPIEAIDKELAATLCRQKNQLPSAVLRNISICASLKTGLEKIIWIEEFSVKGGALLLKADGDQLYIFAGDWLERLLREGLVQNSKTASGNPCVPGISNSRPEDKNAFDFLTDRLYKKLLDLNLLVNEGNAADNDFVELRGLFVAFLAEFLRIEIIKKQYPLRHVSLQLSNFGTLLADDWIDALFFASNPDVMSSAFGNPNHAHYLTYLEEFLHIMISPDSLMLRDYLPSNEKRISYANKLLELFERTPPNYSFTLPDYVQESIKAIAPDLLEQLKVLYSERSIMVLDFQTGE